MKKLCIIPAAIIVLMLVSFSYPQQDSWVPYTTTDGHFSMTFPGKPEESSSMDKTEDGAPFKINFVSYSPDDDHVYMAGWIDMRNMYPLNKSMKEMLENSRDGATGSMKATKVETITTHLTGDPYIEFTMEADKLTAKERIYIINKYQYSIITIFSKETGIPAAADRFITSFKYLK